MSELGQGDCASVQIRAAQGTDAASVAALLSLTFYPQRGWRALLTPVMQMGMQHELLTRLQSLTPEIYVCLLCEKKQGRWSQLLGTVELSQRPVQVPGQSRQRVPYISNLAVHPQYRHQGIGERLLQSCESVSRHWQASALYLHVRSENRPAQALYLKLGYQKYREPPTAARYLYRKDLHTACSEPAVMIHG
ncbi:GNAT family N-acetyltransferase [Lyngbya confervoides]|uniref:GNAT family N-acetyltransferase n=1 Tax=Lyngbya confervoides BDU141951 TaxID=1574623 RepID=A0ABD4T6P7_9CYAN|nr:GNAT family N-acetyltransferase [Lyngbya confervoides]MCM1984384.1 GNAT family N-acetyltransferase [Lyngbya confervoides BDU141951]